MKMLEILEAAIGAVLTHGICFSGGPIRDPIPLPLPAEAEMLGSVSVRRQREFAWGRYHARQALRQLGFAPVPILRKVDRAPLWPSGVIGSISHSSSHGGAVVGRSNTVLALGLDIEDQEPLGADLAPIICTPAELERAEWCSGRSGPGLIFAIKEAVYKSYAPATGEFLDFHDVCVRISDQSSSFEAEIINSEKPAIFGSRTINGVYFPFAGGVVALAARFRHM
ncbi:4'-phosphopantetheinyl transferase superfamily protein [Bradyrhizobium sp. BEA-2-5]|uniref:4'-phosphopantetheinyl transferase family protein n=1 Tax=Bradyrhizobium sp. BEA-2-5 TaxID=3080015 RepID=UPI00293E3B83|nr:4'-phosphopantetheinyl transferase superfamily protein [Bradyrhizobium sp. BEA-2-5]WOH80119.1 4'-phosphopantetheinyl transferase superfamily protein [Bradyrhizobium sp. BEA-2-5]